MKNEISRVENYNSNADEILGWAEATDSALDSIGSLVNDIKNSLTSIGGTYTETEINSVKNEILEITKQIADVFNTSYAGQNLFSGSATDEKAVTITENQDGTITIALNKKANDVSLKAEISAGITLEYNTTATEVTNGGELFDTINEVIQIISADPLDMDAVLDVKGKLDKGLEDILALRTTVGAKMNTIENIKNNNISNLEQLTETLSSINDIDVAEKAIELQTAQLAYMASLQVGTKLMQTTILDYV
jgi:flagellar hook-associated protein 3 FlgL